MNKHPSQINDNDLLMNLEYFNNNQVFNYLLLKKI